MNDEIKIIFALLTSALIVYLAVPKIIIFSREFKLLNPPSKRDSHNVRMPIFGGIAIFSGIIFSMLFWGDFQQSHFILASLFIVFFIGMIDDLLNLSPLKKLVGQFLAIAICMYGHDIIIFSMHGVLGFKEINYLFSILFTFFVCVVIINSYNLIDGVDGLDAGIGIISSISFGTIAYFTNQINIAILSFSLTGALIAFIRYNFNPAHIFMGDTGSLVVGMTLSVLAINLINSGIIIEKIPPFEIKYINKGPLLSIAFLAIPLFDSLRVFVVRTIKKTNPLSAGRGHIHHALLDLGLNHKTTSILLCITQLLLIIISFLLLPININLSILILSIIAFLTLYIPFFIKQKNSKKK